MIDLLSLVKAISKKARGFAGRFQFIYWGQWGGLWYKRLEPEESGLGLIYSSRLMLGLWEIRTWRPKDPATAARLLERYRKAGDDSD